MKTIIKKKIAKIVKEEELKEKAIYFGFCPKCGGKLQIEDKLKHFLSVVNVITYKCPKCKWEMKQFY